MGLPAAVFLHNRFSGSGPLSFLFFFSRGGTAVSSSPSPGFFSPSATFPLSRPRRRRIASPARQEKLAFFSSPTSATAAAYISLTSLAPGKRERASHPRARCVQLAGGCILITFMSSDIPARFIAPAPADSTKTWNQPPPLSSFPFRLPFPRAVFLTASRFARHGARLLRFFSLLSPGSPPSLLWPAQSTLHDDPVSLYGCATATFVASCPDRDLKFALV